MKKTSKFSNCIECPLNPQPIVIGETNCSDDISKVNLVVFAEAPAQEEVKEGRPLVGSAGKIFREHFESIGLNNFNYLISNVVLCTNLVKNEDTGRIKTVTPPKSAIEKCKPNWKKILKEIKPKIILVMGSIPMNALGIQGSITEKRGNIYHTDHGLVYVTFHPSYIARKIKEKKPEFLDLFKKDLEEIKLILENKDFIDKKGPKLLKPYSYKLPDWCYDENHVLIDTQYLKKTNEIIYIFKDKEGNNIYHKEQDSDYYYYYRNEHQSTAPMIDHITNVSLGKGKYARGSDKARYEGDMRSEVKASVDYRYVRNDRPENDQKPSIMYFDIEVFSNESRIFPDPKKATAAINSISYKIDEEDVVVMLSRLPEIDDVEKLKESEFKVEIYNSEKELIEKFANIVKTSGINILAGYNSNYFDIPTIFNRAKKLGVSLNLFSPLGFTDYNYNKVNDFCIYGIYCLDMLDLYKDLTYAKEESYKLNYIAQKVLGEGKVAYEGTLDKLYKEDILKFVEYSGVDTDLLWELNDALKHIDLRFEQVRICSTTWKAAEKTTGLVDPLMISFAKKRNLVCRNSLMKKEDMTIPGAYVRDPESGRHEWVVDFDYSSLYPSLICTLNLGPNTYVAKVVDDDNIDISVNTSFNKLTYCMIYGIHDKIPDKIKVIYNPLSNSDVVEVDKQEFLNWISEHNYITTVNGTIFKNHEEEESFLKEICIYLLKKRKEYKKEMYVCEEAGDKDGVVTNDCRQMSYKILVNSCYGAIANYAFRFFHNDIASSITVSGREAIQFVGFHLGEYMETGDMLVHSDFAEDYEKRKIPYLAYTDTDSLYVMIGDYLKDNNEL